MFSTQPGELLANRAFTLKMLLLLAAGCNAAVVPCPRFAAPSSTALARAQMLLSTVIWLARAYVRPLDRLSMTM